MAETMEKAAVGVIKDAKKRYTVHSCATDRPETERGSR